MVPFAISVVARTTGTPVPCVTLTTVDQQVFVSDEGGVVAFDEPGLMGEDVWFTVGGPATVEADWLGFRGVALHPTEGGFARVEVDVTSVPGCSPGSAHTRAVLDGYTDAPFRIAVVDAATGRGVPLVRVDVGGVPYPTDSAGNVAVRNPDVLGATVDVGVVAWHGYAPAAPAAPVLVEEGGSVTLEVVREQVAARLYRLTGRGVYRDTLLLGLPAPTASPALNAQVAGQDSILVLEADAGPLWLWGDTLRPSYPLGLFDVAGAVPSPLPDPADGVDLAYFTGADGFARAMAPIPGDGPTWLTAPMAVDDGGVRRVAVIYGKFDGLAATERGVAVLDEATARFVRDTTWPTLEPELAHQVPVVRDGFVYLHEHLRLPATLTATRDPTAWEVWSPLAGGVVERHADGQARYAWRPIGADTDPRSLPAADAWDGHVVDAGGRRIDPHNGSIVASAWRGRWARVFTRSGGDDSLLGELWYAEADTPLGPWLTAARIVEHDDYTLYNPYVHEALQGDGRELLVQGSYTTFFAGSDPTPLYDYNQLVFGLDLEDERVVLPVAVYDRGDGVPATLPDLRPGDPEPVVSFLALDRPAAGALGVYRTAPACAGGVLAASADPPGHPRIWVHGQAGPGRVAWDEVPGTFVWAARGPTHVPVLDWLPAVRLEAGDDRCLVEDAPGAGATVALDASASAGTDGGTFRWELDGALLADGATASAVLPVGVHHVVLAFTSAAGTPAYDEVLVQVDAGAGGTTTPAPPGERPAREADGGCGCDGVGGGPAGLLLLITCRRRRRP